MSENIVPALIIAVVALIEVCIIVYMVWRKWKGKSLGTKDRPL